MKKEIYSRIYYNALAMFQLCCKIYYGVYEIYVIYI